MNNRKFYSYERNNYYYGKLLTSRDFQVEQGYMNDKRRLGNRLLHGSGIAAGLRVIAADDTAIVLQSGCALDGGGREIVVPETRVIKLSTIEGSRELRTDTAYLGIRYKELMEDKVYAVMGNADKQEDSEGAFNHIREGYELFLQDVSETAPLKQAKEEYLSKTVLFEDEDYAVVQEVAVYLPADSNLTVNVTVYKKRQTQELLTVKYQLGIDGLQEQKFSIKLENLKLERYEKKTLTQVIMPKEEVRFLTDFRLKVTKLEVMKDKQKCRVEEPAPVEVAVTDKGLLSLIMENTYKKAMDTELEEGYDEKLYLAKLYLIHTGERILLERIEEVPFKQYIYSAEQMMLLEQLKQYYPALTVQSGEPKIIHREAEKSVPEKQEKEKSFVTGVFDLSLGSGADAGKTAYSEEIMHGLGEGPVYVEAAYEILNKENGSATEEIVLGDTDLFAAPDGDEKQLQFSCGIKILPERGTFIVAVKPKGKTAKTSLRVRWYACRAEDTDKSISRLKSKQGMLLIAPDTITTTPRGIVQIQPQFVNMSEEACRYEVLDQAGGKIDNNGIYTAPTAEGVYEVKVSCISAPEIFAHAYIIVSAEKKKS